MASLSAQALAVLRRVWGYEAFRGPQQAIVEHLIAGGDALVLMPTGAGKSLCFQVPAIAREGVGVVVSPLIALMQDQVQALRENGVRAAYLNSTLAPEEAAGIERSVRAGELDLLYVAPERLLGERCLQLLSATRLALFAIDEAHCVSQWGHDFRPEYLGLSVLAERFARVPRIALTATADPLTRQEIRDRLGLSGAREFVSSFDRPNIRYTIVEKTDPQRQLIEVLESHAGDSAIIYCGSRRKVEDTAARLARLGYPAEPYHAGMPAAQRAGHQTRFVREESRIMVATLAFGMGIDKPDVRLVAHLDLPRSLEAYYQETGRAGRDGLPAHAWMAFGLQDVVRNRRMIDESEADEAHQRVSRARLEAMVGLAQTDGCRRVQLLAYFGEPIAACGNCDNCLNPPRRWDATEAARKFLSCVYRIRQAGGYGYGTHYVVDVLRGERSARILERGHDRLSTFGIGADLDRKTWLTLARQLVSRGYLEIEHEHHGVLALATSAVEVLKGGQAVHLAQEMTPAAPRGRSRKAVAGTTQPGQSGGSSVDEAIDDATQARFDRLRQWRLATARAQGVPPYVIFHDAHLMGIARQAPATLAALGALPGVGAAKLARYGASLLQVL